jgi:glycerol-3-phosphate dehydrogenase
MKHEWARTTDDVLWRRSKLGLTLSKAEKDALAQFMVQVLAQSAPP